MNLIIILTTTPLATLANLFPFENCDAFAADLSKAFVDENFKFLWNCALAECQNKSRWKRGVDLVEGTLGEALGNYMLNNISLLKIKLKWNNW